MSEDYLCPLPYLYKYYDPKGLLATLEGRACLWSHPRRFNDPFDTQFKRRWEESLDEFLQGRADIPKALGKSASFRRLMAKAHQDEVVRKTYLWEMYFQQKLNNIVMFCLTEDPANLLMWAHYARNHTGGVIQFANRPDLPDCQQAAARKVIYQETLPVFYFQEFLHTTDDAERKRDMADRFWDMYTLTKSTEWHYEKEWRLLQELEEPAASVLLDFDAREVTAVYLGCRMSAAAKTETIATVQKRYPRVMVFQAATHPEIYALDFMRVI